MVVCLGSTVYNVGERPIVILHTLLQLIAMSGHQTQQKQKIILQYITKRVVIILYDNNTIGPYSNRGLGQQ